MFTSAFSLRFCLLITAEVLPWTARMSRGEHPLSKQCPTTLPDEKVPKFAVSTLAPSSARGVFPPRGTSIFPLVLAEPIGGAERGPRVFGRVRWAGSEGRCDEGLSTFLWMSDRCLLVFGFRLAWILITFLLL
ncbi:hypothetical protein OF83DRAFT_378077 [Amylostereum chailletii]|nr:hypothetical protein OF83DRAFT_378077 [Amylostereum chailletii]